VILFGKNNPFLFVEFEPFLWIGCALGVVFGHRAVPLMASEKSQLPVISTIQP